MLIGFCGRANAGKTTAAKIFIEKGGFYQAKFAAPLKLALRTAYGLSIEHTDGPLKEVPTQLLGGKTPRDAMEWFGEESRKRFGQDVWVKRWFDLHSGDLSYGKNFVFDDVRNEIEARAIQDRGGYVVRISNNRTDCREPFPSETRLDRIFQNATLLNQSKSDFEQNVHHLLSRLKKPDPMREARAI
jgi:hypothetical protein